MNPESPMRRAIALSRERMRAGDGGPFGAVIVRHGEVIAEGWNQVVSANDPTAHAEVMAIRRACASLGSFELSDCAIYTSCEPCPMCLAAIYWARCEAIFYGSCAAVAAVAGFDDAYLYDEIKRPLEQRAIPTMNLLPEQAIVSFDLWRAHAARIDY